MFLGHFAVALAAKRVAPRASLGTFVLAAQWLDLLWPFFLMLGLERVRIVPGLMEASPLDFVHYPITHSLVGAAGWAALLGFVYHVRRRYVVGAWLVGGLVLSHWLLDAIAHRPDLPLWPGSAAHIGLGLWHSVPATVLVELALLAAGLFVYLRTTRAQDRIGRYALAAMITLLVSFFFGALLGPPPPDTRTLALSALGLWLFVPLGYWIDRHRGPRTS
jgi:membrane-bound metal-dependent hydrolase YbcI (DUF457 family)